MKKIKKAKGINKDLVKNEKYTDILFNKKMIRLKMKRIQSKLHKIGAYDVVKSLCLALMIKDMY